MFNATALSSFRDSVGNALGAATAATVEATKALGVKTASVVNTVITVNDGAGTELASMAAEVIVPADVVVEAAAQTVVEAVAETAAEAAAESVTEAATETAASGIVAKGMGFIAQHKTVVIAGAAVAGATAVGVAGYKLAKKKGWIGKKAK